MYFFNVFSCSSPGRASSDICNAFMWMLITCFARVCNEHHLKCFSFQIPSILHQLVTCNKQQTERNLSTGGHSLVRIKFLDLSTQLELSIDPTALLIKYKMSSLTDVHMHITSMTAIFLSNSRSMHHSFWVGKHALSSNYSLITFKFPTIQAFQVSWPLTSKTGKV